MNASEYQLSNTTSLAALELASLPELFRPTPAAARRTLEFFTANIRNSNTRQAYARVFSEFAAWCPGYGLQGLAHIEPVYVATYIEQLELKLSAPLVKQHLAVLRVLFDWLVVRQILPKNPAGSMRGPRHSVRKSNTPVLAAYEAHDMLDAI